MRTHYCLLSVADELSLQLTDAYTILSDTEKRKAYDAQHPSTRAKPRSTTQRKGGTGKTQTRPPSSVVTELVEISERAIERIAKLGQDIKENSEMVKESAARQHNLVQLMNSTTVPILNELCRQETALAEASKGLSGFFSALRRSKKERDEGRRRASWLERARLAKEAEYHEQNEALEKAIFRTAEFQGLIAHARRQKTELETKLEDLLRRMPEAVPQGQPQEARGTRGRARTDDQMDQAAMAHYCRAALELKKTMRRHREDPDEQTVWVLLPPSDF